MIVTPTPLAGAFVLDIEPLADDRGFFARTFCAAELAAHGMNVAVAQCSVSVNTRKGTLRGMHFQAAPHEEDKLVRCTAGAIFDVLVDARAGSATFGQWFGAELSAANRRALYIPKGFAHGFLTLADATEVLYQISVPFAPGFGRGFRWDDPEVGIRWPSAPAVISDRDATYPTLREVVG
ncbi:dTDP-4-dehydrorhamnose 3,5-epimerase [Novispirillum sp. DQ9]|uniref:dTDP-4-dehydrorhamnose 3,5-epimerase n=1 Tax=Novispirillum sp. DQ9 TaxID=3398612 RepID=UPI003C7C8611